MDEELTRIGAKQLLEAGQLDHAAFITYQWLSKEVLRQVRRHEGGAPNLYDMLSHLVDKGTAFGFRCESRIEENCIVFVITNDRVQENRVIPIFLELFLAHICEQLCNIKSEITHSGKDTIVKLTLPKLI